MGIFALLLLLILLLLLLAVVVVLVLAVLVLVSSMAEFNGEGVNSVIVAPCAAPFTATLVVPGVLLVLETTVGRIGSVARFRVGSDAGIGMSSSDIL